MIGHQEAACRQRRLDAQQRRQLLIFHHGELGGGAGGGETLAGDGEEHLAMEDDLAFAEDRVVAGTHRADIVLARDIGGGEHGDDTGGGANRRQIELGDPRMSLGRGAGKEMQQIRGVLECRRHRGPRR